MCNRIADPYFGEELKKRQEEAKIRIKTKVPPGYKDLDRKDEERAGGDALIWFKMLDRSKEKQCPIIFVTDDQKEDWWWTHKGLTHGPRPELGQEMWSTAQQRFYMYTLSAFLELAGKYLGQNVPAEVVKEVKEHEQEQKALAHAQAAEQANLAARRKEIISELQLRYAERDSWVRQLTDLNSRTESNPQSKITPLLNRWAREISQAQLNNIEGTISSLTKELDALNIALLPNSTNEDQT